MPKGALFMKIEKKVLKETNKPIPKLNLKKAMKIQ